MHRPVIDFIHIPKNCGHSIKQLITDNELINVRYNGHGCDAGLLDPDTSMVILRDPADRFVSAFYYSKIYPDCALVQNEHLIKTPSDLVNALKDDPKNEYLIAENNHNIGGIYLGISWIWTPQYYWFNNAKYVLFHNNIDQDFKDFLDITHRPQIKLPHKNMSHRIDWKFTDCELSYIKERYATDYSIIEANRDYKWK